MNIQIETLIAQVESLQKGLGQVHDALVALGQGGQPPAHHAALRERPAAHDVRAADVLRKVTELTREGRGLKASELLEGLEPLLPEIKNPRALSSWLGLIVNKPILVEGCEHTLRRTHRGAFNFYTVEVAAKDDDQPSADGLPVEVMKIIRRRTHVLVQRASDLLPHLEPLLNVGSHQALAAWLKGHLVGKEILIEDGVYCELAAVPKKGTTFYTVCYRGDKKPAELRQLDEEKEAERVARAAKREAAVAVEMARSQRLLGDKWLGAVRRLLADFLARHPDAEAPLRLQVSSGALEQDLRDVLGLALADLNAAAKPSPPRLMPASKGAKPVTG